jgi:hypothetical protein
MKRDHQIPSVPPDLIIGIDTTEGLAEVLRLLRRRLARHTQDSLLTYRELAMRTGWAHGVIGDYFTGKTLPPTDRFDILVRLIGANPAEQVVLATARDRVEESRRSRKSTESAGTVGPPMRIPVPRELPPDVSGFTGRNSELAALNTLLRPADRPGSMVICAINGIGGAGKSALAVHAAHLLADRFPHGQLYVDLQGATCQRAPLSPMVALTQLSRALGVAGHDVPDNQAEASTMFRALTATRQLLVLLDNAADTHQVRPLLPTSPSCAVLVTSRQILATLDNATHLHLDVLPGHEAVELLGNLAGQQRVAEDQAAADKIARQCDNLPLALRIAGARLVARPRWPIHVLAARLADARHRLDELRHEDLDMRASVQASYQMLPDDGPSGAAATFTLLALLGGADVSLPVAARLIGRPEPEAESTMEYLVDMRLLETTAPGRYRYHDLFRLFARELAPQRYDAEQRTQAIVRAMTWYVATGWQAFRLLRPGDARPALKNGRWDQDGLRFADRDAALEWLETERTNLLAVLAQAVGAPEVPAEIPIALAQALAPFFQIRGDGHDLIMASHAVLALARRIGDRAAEAQACFDLAVGYDLRGQHKDAVTHLHHARTLFRDVGDQRGEAASWTGLGEMPEGSRPHAEVSYLRTADTHLPQGVADSG